MLILENEADLDPIVAAAVEKTLSAFRADEAKLGDRLAFTEAEAARLIGLAQHQLRDERLRGRIGASAVVGRGIRYLRSDLMTYLRRRRTEPVA